MKRLAPLCLALLAACGADAEGSPELVERSADPARASASGARAGRGPAGRARAAAEAEQEGQTGVRELRSGLVVETTAGGRGRAARVGDRLLVHYEARLEGSDEVVDSTRATGIPFAFALGRGEVMPALDVGLVGARPGAELVIRAPAATAYGERGLGRVPADAALVLDVRVVRVQAP